MFSNALREPYPHTWPLLSGTIPPGEKNSRELTFGQAEVGARFRSDDGSNCTASVPFEARLG